MTHARDGEPGDSVLLSRPRGEWLLARQVLAPNRRGGVSNAGTGARSRRYQPRYGPPATSLDLSEQDIPRSWRTGVSRSEHRWLGTEQSTAPSTLPLRVIAHACGRR